MEGRIKNKQNKTKQQQQKRERLPEEKNEIVCALFKKKKKKKRPRNVRQNKERNEENMVRVGKAYEAGAAKEKAPTIKY